MGYYYIVSSSNDYLICCNEYQANILTSSVAPTCGNLPVLLKVLHNIYDM